jgi:16S rRNA (adenine1518-N6/adenine1519-N6)-dimethyltransferase
VTKRHIPRKRFGQHFLADRAILDRIVEAIHPVAEDIFLEIGPGEGVLTARILAAVQRMHAIEIDRDLAAGLRKTYGDERLDVIEGDALKLDFSGFPEGMRVIGNLPYNISTPLIFHLCEFANRIRDMHFMLQKEVVERMAAASSTAAYGRLSVMTQYWFDVEPLFVVPATAFRPPPKVQSMMVRLRPSGAGMRNETDARLLKKVVTAAFSHRRKTLRNALAELFTEARLLELGVDPGKRAENLSLADYVTLSRHMDA